MNSKTTHSPDALNTLDDVLDEDTVMECTAQSNSKNWNDWNNLLLAVCIRKHLKDVLGSLFFPSVVLNTGQIDWNAIHQLAINAPAPRLVKTYLIGDVKYTSHWMTPESCAEKGQYLLLNFCTDDSNPESSSSSELGPCEFNLKQVDHLITWFAKKVCSIVDRRGADVENSNTLSTSMTSPAALESNEKEISLPVNATSRESLGNDQEKNKFEALESQMPVEKSANDEGYPQTSVVFSKERTSQEDENKQVPIPRNEDQMQDQKSKRPAHDSIVTQHKNKEASINEEPVLPKRQKPEVCEERKSECEDILIDDENEEVPKKVEKPKPDVRERRKSKCEDILIDDENEKVPKKVDQSKPSVGEKRKSKCEIILIDDENEKVPKKACRSKPGLCESRKSECEVILIDDENEAVPKKVDQSKPAVGEKRKSKCEDILIDDENKKVPKKVDQSKPSVGEKRKSKCEDILIDDENEEVPKKVGRSKPGVCESRKSECEVILIDDENKEVPKKVFQSKPNVCDRKSKDECIMGLPAKKEKQHGCSDRPNDTIWIVWKPVCNYLSAFSERMTVLQQNKAIKKPTTLELISEKVKNGSIQTIIQLQNHIYLVMFNLRMVVPGRATLENWVELLNRVLEMFKILSTHPKGSWTESLILSLLKSDAPVDNKVVVSIQQAEGNSDENFLTGNRKSKIQRRRSTKILK